MVFPLLVVTSPSVFFCLKLQRSAESQKMANLPQDRLEPAPPFTYCAVDFFGPWYIKEQRKEVKRYGVLSTCMSSRAIHLETSATPRHLTMKSRVILPPPGVF